MNTLRSGTLSLWLSLIVGASAVAADLPSAQEYRANWPRFRGPAGDGVSTAADLPVTCDVKAGTNVTWRVEVPAAGFGSPVIWGDRVYLTGGDEEKQEAMAFELGSGKLLWRSAVPKPADDAEKVEIPDQCGMAAATPATDGRRLYTMFTNGLLAAFDLDGKLAWSKRIAVPKNQYGHATSLLTWQDRVIVQMDQAEADDHLSKIYALDGATGAVVWEKERPVGASWATPLVFENATRAQVITAASPWVIGYSPKDGTELWRAECLDGEVTPSPIVSGETLLVVTPSTKLQAIRTDGTGEVTTTHLGWKAEDGVPDITSPASNGELVFLADSSGTLTCYDAKDGRKQWEHDLGDGSNASPSIAGKKVYVVTKNGTLIVIDAAREFKELGRSPLGEPVLASPAFTAKSMIVRGAKHLFCIEAH